MKLQSIVQQALNDMFRLTELSDGVRVFTHCIYPSGELVKVTVRGGRDHFFISDDGRALHEFEAAGAEISNPERMRMIRYLVQRQGLQLSGRAIVYAPCELDGLAASIAVVANASRELAEHLFARIKVKRYRNFKALLRELLEAKFTKQIREEIIVGQSNKPHKFEQLIALPNGKRIIVDPVMHDPASINARVVAHLDVRLAHYVDLEQRLVYDDEDDWKAEDLNLLQVGTGAVIPFSKASAVLTRLAG